MPFVHHHVYGVWEIRQGDQTDVALPSATNAGARRKRSDQSRADTRPGDLPKASSRQNLTFSFYVLRTARFCLKNFSDKFFSTFYTTFFGFLDAFFRHAFSRWQSGWTPEVPLALWHAVLLAVSHAVPLSISLGSWCPRPASSAFSEPAFSFAASSAFSIAASSVFSVVFIAAPASFSFASSCSSPASFGFSSSFASPTGVSSSSSTFAFCLASSGSRSPISLALGWAPRPSSPYSRAGKGTDDGI